MPDAGRRTRTPRFVTVTTPPPHSRPTTPSAPYKTGHSYSSTSPSPRGRIYDEPDVLPARRGRKPSISARNRSRSRSHPSRSSSRLREHLRPSGSAIIHGIASVIHTVAYVCSWIIHKILWFFMILTVLTVVVGTFEHLTKPLEPIPAVPQDPLAANHTKTLQAKTKHGFLRFWKQHKGIDTDSELNVADVSDEIAKSIRDMKDVVDKLDSDGVSLSTSQSIDAGRFGHLVTAVLEVTNSFPKPDGLQNAQETYASIQSAINDLTVNTITSSRALRKEVAEHRRFRFNRVLLSLGLLLGLPGNPISTWFDMWGDHLMTFYGKSYWALEDLKPASQRYAVLDTKHRYALEEINKTKDLLKAKCKSGYSKLDCYNNIEEALSPKSLARGVSWDDTQTTIATLLHASQTTEEALRVYNEHLEYLLLDELPKIQHNLTYANIFHAPDRWDAFLQNFLSKANGTYMLQ